MAKCRRRVEVATHFFGSTGLRREHLVWQERCDENADGALLRVCAFAAKAGLRRGFRGAEQRE